MQANGVDYHTELRNPIWRNTPKWGHFDSSNRDVTFSYKEVTNMEGYHHVLGALAESWMDPRWHFNHMREAEVNPPYRSVVMIFENRSFRTCTSDPRQIRDAFAEEIQSIFDSQDEYVRNPSYVYRLAGSAGVRDEVEHCLREFPFELDHVYARAQRVDMPTEYLDPRVIYVYFTL